jgi:hypothetical protein
VVAGVAAATAAHGIGHVVRDHFVHDPEPVDLDVKPKVEVL